MNARTVLKSLALALAAMVANVAASFLWVFLYSMAVAPGQSEAAYQAYAMEAAPWCSVIAGVPILFGAGWLLARWLGAGGWRASIGAGIAYVLLDGIIMAAAGMFTAFAAIEILSYASKLAASAAGGALAGRPSSQG